MGSARAKSEAMRAERKPRSGVGAERQRSGAAKANTDAEHEMKRSWRGAAEERNEMLSKRMGAGRANGGKQNPTH